MSNTYFRPMALVFGADARQAVARGHAGALGGMAGIAFTMVEIITRQGRDVERKAVSYRDVAREALCRELTRPRHRFAGLDLSATRVMGIVNVTPDSFSDGGLLAGADAAIALGLRQLEEGADIVDVGGESTRPGSDAVDEGEELRRVLPVVEGLQKHGIVSVDTRKASVMRACAAAGARIINDVSGLTHDAASVDTVVAQAFAGCDHACTG